MTRVRAAACAVIVVLAGLASGCTAYHNGLGTHDSVCFQGLPGGGRRRAPPRSDSPASGICRPAP